MAHLGAFSEKVERPWQEFGSDGKSYSQHAEEDQSRKMAVAWCRLD
jgi:hypothetical protein